MTPERFEQIREAVQRKQEAGRQRLVEETNTILADRAREQEAYNRILAAHQASGEPMPFDDFDDFFAYCQGVRD